MEPADLQHLANCWLQADVLPAEAAADVRRTVHGVVPAFDNSHMDVSDIVAFMANATISEEFEGVGDSEREVAARQWLTAEEDIEAIGATVDMVVLSEEAEDE